MTTTSKAMNVAALARAAEVRPDTIRCYERVGLLDPPPRTSGDHRRYDDAALDRLRFIRGAQRLGLRLAEIRELLDLRDQGQCPCDGAVVSAPATAPSPCCGLDSSRSTTRSRGCNGSAASLLT
jgi:DNA-binding transcriptional MerR regulator